MYTSKKVGKMYYLSVIASFLVVITLTMALNITGLNLKLIDHYEEAHPKPIQTPRIRIPRIPHIQPPIIFQRPPPMS